MRCNRNINGAFKALAVRNIVTTYQESMKHQLLKICAPESILEKVTECAPLSPTCDYQMHCESPCLDKPSVDNNQSYFRFGNAAK